MTARNTGSTFLQLTIPLFILLVVCSLAVQKTNSFIFLNSFHSDQLNLVFRCISFLGDGLFPLILAILFFLLQQKMLAAKILFSFLASGILAQVLKAFFHAPRPKALFDSMHLPYQYFIDGVTHSGMNSFPSGHTTTVFALATTLACNTSCRYRCAIFFILATLTLYSRIYLGQHFVEDTAAGLFIGTGVAFFGEWLAGRLRFPISNRSVTAADKSMRIEL
jgi:membrane-associated phospholipid phosphatase